MKWWATRPTKLFSQRFSLDKFPWAADALVCPIPWAADALVCPIPWATDVPSAPFRGRQTSRLPLYRLFEPTNSS